MIVLENYINGKLVAPTSGKHIPSYNPALGSIFSEVPDSNAKDVDNAVSAAKDAFPLWSQLSAENRSQYLLKIADILEEDLENLALAESMDNGKPVKLAREVDIPRAISNFRFFGKAAPHFASESHPMEDGTVNYTTRTPLGVVACISPWNLPLYLFTWKIAPALASGNTVVAKPSEITPYTAYLLSKACIKANLPKGVLNIVHGLGPSVGAPLCEHKDVKAISFTGGTETGKSIAKSVATHFKKLSLEMGGKNPNIVFADADLDKAVEISVRSSFANQGQICLCGSRILVEEKIYEEFKAKFLEKVKALKVGNPKEDSSNLGAIVSKPHYDKILSYIQLAKEEGGKILTGGEAVHVAGECANGWFIAPTVVEGLKNNARCNMEEVFGPFVSITSFKTEEEAIEIANITEYGLAASLHTSDLSRAHRVASKLDMGIVWINCWLLRDLRTPFGGMKNSGMGREGGWEAMKFFTEMKNICIKL